MNIVEISGRTYGSYFDFVDFLIENFDKIVVRHGYGVRKVIERSLLEITNASKAELAPNVDFPWRFFVEAEDDLAVFMVLKFGNTNAYDPAFPKD